MKRNFAVILLVFLALAAAIPSFAAVGTGYSVQSDGNQKLYRIDLATGVATPLGVTGFDGIEGLAFDPGCKKLYGVDDVKDRLVTCDLKTGGCTTVGSLGLDVTDTGLAFANDGRLFMSTDAPKNPLRFFGLDLKTGGATWIGNQGTEVTGLAGNLFALYGLGGDGKDNLVIVDPATGKATPVGPLGAVTLQDGGLDFDRDGTLYGLNDLGPGTIASGKPSQLFKIDTETGKATVVVTLKDPSGKPINGFEGLAIDGGICAAKGFGQAAAIEAPALDALGLGLLAAGLATAALMVLRRV
ncbi:MAG TPA: hypothetical protein VNM67_22515 [Thermoanaerobaculia bacterium]|jgi:hypothetical protein|nr:hypothetical protein [Thermoanaerobaculia bacterium]